jgi:hypothetical protein
MKIMDSGRSVVRSRQRGFITMVVSLSILMLSSLVVFNVSKSILLEQRVVNNQFRAIQAFEAADAGLATAISYLKQNPDRNNDGNIDPVFDLNGDGIGDSNNSRIGPATVIISTRDISSGDMTSIEIRSQGFSDDRSATQVITFVLVTVNPLPNSPENPLTSRSSAIISGSATVHNPEGHSTIWSGGNVDLGSNNTTSTRVPDIGHAGYPACMDVPMTCRLVSASNRLSLGVDVIENDSSLAALTSDEFFGNYFGMLPTTYRAAMVTVDTTPARLSSDVHLATHEVIWIEGNTAFGNITIGCTTAVTGGNTCPAANVKPSIVIVNGNASFGGTPHIYGLLFVRGSVSMSGSTTVHGGMVVGGNISSNAGGSLDVWYSSGVLTGTRLAGPSTGSAGSWRDF